MAFTLNRRLAQLVDSNGQLNTGKIPNDYITSDHVADNTITAAMLHTSFTVSTSNLTAIDTDDVSEGSTNLYYTDTRVGDYIYGNRTYGSINSIGNISVAAGTGAKYLIVRSTSNQYSQIFGYGIRTSPGTSTYSIWPVANDSSSLDFGNFSSTLNWKNVRFHSTNGLSIGYTQFIDSSRNLTNIGTISSGAITSTGEVEATALDINGNGDISGNLTLGGYLAGPATFTIDPAAVGDNTGTVVIAGNLQVDGTTTTINSTTMEVDDLNLTLASGAANAAAANGAGITVDGASATITYNNSSDRWVFNKSLDVAGNLLLGTAGSNNGVLSLRTYDDAANRWDVYTWTDDSFRLNYNGSGADEFVILNDGKVGIGTVLPGEKLHVYGNARIEPSSGENFIISRDTAGPYFGTASNHSLRLITNNGSRVNFDTDGRVLIGVTSGSVLDGYIIQDYK